MAGCLPAVSRLLCLRACHGWPIRLFDRIHRAGLCASQFVEPRLQLDKGALKRGKGRLLFINEVCLCLVVFLQLRDFGPLLLQHFYRVEIDFVLCHARGFLVFVILNGLHQSEFMKLLGDVSQLPSSREIGAGVCFWLSGEDFFKIVLQRRDVPFVLP